MVTFENVCRVAYETSSFNEKNVQVQYVKTGVCFCCLFIFDQTTMDQEQKCLTSLSFDLSFVLTK